MTVEVGTPLLVGFLLAMVRGAAWLLVAPPFNSRVIPGPVIRHACVGEGKDRQNQIA